MWIYHVDLCSIMVLQAYVMRTTDSDSEDQQIHWMPDNSLKIHRLIEGLCLLGALRLTEGSTNRYIEGPQAD